ncbi:hypothetical protein DOJK_01709 [Patescibacteria group bacterium]|jgi:hypothetical protein|nr:hypothetical protein [Candidatus Dojkabacteria bacterium]CAG1022492.1 hypothetical protein DOJK_01709 [Patescibacteria group bacterium]
MSKKKFLTFAVVITQLVIFSVPVLAGGLTNVNQNFQIPNPTRYGSLEDIINAVTTLIRPVFIIAFGAMVLYGGWIRLTSQGNPDKVKSSSQIIVAAIVGFAIAVFAPTIVDFAGRLLGIQGGLIQN